MNIYKLFEDSVKDLDIPKDWEYSGWHNDACPSYIVGSYDIQIFIFHLNPLKRDKVGEFKDSDRFQIFNSETQEELGSFNDFDLVKAEVEKLQLLQKENRPMKFKFQKVETIFSECEIIAKDFHQAEVILEEGEIDWDISSCSDDVHLLETLDIKEDK